MSKILSYNKKTTGEGWIPLGGQYSADEIEMIDDPNGGLSKAPRTAIPSPFAQMDLVKNAFRRLAMHGNLTGELMDEMLVSNALDVAQLFFNLNELKGELSTVEWTRDVELPMLKSTLEHRLLGETIEMFLEQDKEAFNFDKMDRLFFLVYKGHVIGSTSPVTLFMATPNAQRLHADLPVEQNVALFSEMRPLWKRNSRFVKYIYALFTAYPDLKKFCGEVNSYLIANFRMLPPAVSEAVLREIGNPAALDLANVERARVYLDQNFSRLEQGVEALGVPFYGLKAEDIKAAISHSDFMIEPTRHCDGPLPLVLQNHLNTVPGESFMYITSPWNDTTVITPEDYKLAPEKRMLPATSHQYPWLTDDDFFQPVLIKLDYTMDRDCFFDGNLTLGSRETDGNDFLLPLKPIFFKYFDVRDLWTTIGGKPLFELEHRKDGLNDTVTATLRIPVRKKGRFITLQRTYVAAQGTDFRYDVKNNRGCFVTLPMALSIFPFVKAPGLSQYNVQLIDRALGQLSNYTVGLTFWHNGYLSQVDDVTVRPRSLKAEKRVGSMYYRLPGDFDYIGVTLTDDHGNTAAQGVICPIWPPYIPGHEPFTFAIDFGTTNTHVESMKGSGMPEPLQLSSASRSRLLAKLYNGESILYDVIMKQEFVPKEIGADYGFPQRTVLSECERMDADTVDEIVSLGDANIPFIYEKESIGYGNRIVPNLKWSTEASASKRVKSYLTELALLMRAKVLLENGDLSKTRLTWFYPLSMKVGSVRKLGALWAKTFEEVFGVPADDNNLIQMPESVAPYYYYKNSSNFRGESSTVASIDIGGGSSDVVVYESNARQPSLLTSFRFAANVLFGDGFSDVPHGDTNPMLRRYVDYFRKLFDADDDKYGELNGILDDIVAKRKSEDINAFLFSVINNKAVGGNDVFSYNMRLGEDSRLKIVFIYFYSSLIYFVARMMHSRGISKPRSVMFSGTGSKVLDIVGTQPDLDLLTRYIFEHVYGEKYGERGFSVIMERKEPKQITCRGALMQVRDGSGCENVRQLNLLMDDYEKPLKYNFSMIDKERLCYDDMENSAIQRKIVDQVKAMNDSFCHLCDDLHVVDRFLVDNRSLQLFKDYVGRDLEHHLIRGWNFVNKNKDDHAGSDTIEDAVFFYPIIGSIRDNLIENL